MEKFTKTNSEKYIKSSSDSQVAQIGHLNSIIEEYNNIFLSMQKFTKTNSEKYIKNTNDAQVAQLGHLNSIIDYLNSIPGPGPITQLAQTSIELASFDTTGFDLTNVNAINFNFDATGSYTGGGGTGPLDLTTPSGESQLLSYLLTVIDNTYSTTSTGTISIVGPILTLTINANVVIPIPMVTVSIALFDLSGAIIPLPLSFA